MKNNPFEKLSGIVLFLVITSCFLISCQSGENKKSNNGVFMKLLLTGLLKEIHIWIIRLNAKFTNGSKTVTVPGFYDGNGIYKIRFSPDELGVGLI